MKTNHLSRARRKRLPQLEVPVSSCCMRRLYAETQENVGTGLDQLIPPYHGSRKLIDWLNEMVSWAHSDDCFRIFLGDYPAAESNRGQSIALGRLSYIPLLLQPAQQE